MIRRPEVSVYTMAAIPSQNINGQYTLTHHSPNSTFVLSKLKKPTIWLFQNGTFPLVLTLMELLNKGPTVLFNIPFV